MTELNVRPLCDPAEIPIGALIPLTPAAQPLTTWADLRASLGEIAWDWPGWIPAGFCIGLGGYAGKGKSMLALRLAQSYLTGCDWPDGTPFTGTTGKVLWAEAEGATPINLARAERWGIPTAGMVVPVFNRELPPEAQSFCLTNPAHLQALETYAARREVRFVVVDSFSAAFPGNENDPAAGQAVRELALLAGRIGKSVLLLFHLHKPGIEGEGAVTLHHIRGHSSLVQYTRAVLGLDTPDHSQPEQRRLVLLKSNLGATPAPLGMEIADEGLLFSDPPSTPARAKSKVQQAMEFLQELLADGPQPSEVVLAEGQQRGLGRKVLDNAKRYLNVETIKRGYQGRWHWQLSGTPPLPVSLPPLLPLESLDSLNSSGCSYPV